jgi:pimeloyl-ACP methyl ester carboxylesterase
MLLAELAFYVAETAQSLQWSGVHNVSTTPTTSTSHGFHLVGHSMGAAVASLYAASFPEQVHSLILLDGAGPIARSAQDVAKHVRQHVQRRQQQQQQPHGKKPPRVYESLNLAVQVRCQTARNFPGNQWISTAAAQAMVERATVPVDKGGVKFVHDPRLQWPSLMYFTEEQTMGLFKDVQCPTALLLAEEGWPFEQDKLDRCLKLLQPVRHVKLPGSHHFHADPETAQAVVDEVVEFLKLHS